MKVVRRMAAWMLAGGGSKNLAFPRSTLIDRREPPSARAFTRTLPAPRGDFGQKFGDAALRHKSQDEKD